MKSACLPNILTRVGQPIGLSCDSDTRMTGRGRTKPSGPMGQLDDTMRHDGFVIEQIGTTGYSSLEDAQEAALPSVAAALARIVSERLDSGEYIVENGVVTRATEVCYE